MPIEIICQKSLDNKSTLKIQSWISDSVRPGRRMFQLALTRGGLTIQFPTDYENYLQSDIRELYSEIKSTEDFENIRRIAYQKKDI